MRKARALIPFVLSLLVAGGTSYYIYGWLQQRAMSEPRTVLQKVETLPVVAAAVKLRWGTKLTQDMFKVIPFLKESLPEGHSSDPSALVGRVLIAQVQENEPILESKLAPKNVTTGGISAVVKPGKRAVAVKGDKVIGLAGLVKPADRVDVMVTFTNMQTKKEETKVVLQDVTVLATGTEYEDSGKGGKPAPVDVYTLEVTPEDGEKLALASTLGRLQLSLRNVSDSETILTTGADISKTLDSFRPENNHRPPRKAARPVAGSPPVKEKPVLSVELIKGTRVSEIKY